MTRSSRHTQKRRWFSWRKLTMLPVIILAVLVEYAVAFVNYWTSPWWREGDNSMHTIRFVIALFISNIIIWILLEKRFQRKLQHYRSEDSSLYKMTAKDIEKKLLKRIEMARSKSKFLSRKRGVK